ncbi:DUF3048 domain-containing protein [Kutzneria kofuensis]|uniref:DUF3048 N-terminal domain-containing protein n=1 Tax=Kutzneria kofuensis TaxID=103725 RepID=UPI0031E8943F
MARIWLVPAAAVLLLVSSCSGRSAAPEPTTTTAVPAGSALVVKIDNVAAARPQTGLTMADVVYVEPVEGGLTRIAAVYLGKLPPVIGPVRSARETDIDLLGQYGRRRWRAPARPRSWRRCCATPAWRPAARAPCPPRTSGTAAGSRRTTCSCTRTSCPRAPAPSRRSRPGPRRPAARR